MATILKRQFKWEYWHGDASKGIEESVRRDGARRGGLLRFLGNESERDGGKRGNDLFDG